MARVLVVDDEADIRELLSMTLTRMGLSVDTAGTGFDAEQLLQKHRYDLCLTDMRLPDGNGLDLLEHVGRHYPSIPVAVITAFGSAENAVAALKAGAAGAISGIAAAFPEVVRRVLDNPWGEEVEALRRLRDALEASGQFVAAAKYALGRRGVPVRPDVRAPLRTLSDDEKAALDAATGSQPSR